MLAKTASFSPLFLDSRHSMLRQSCKSLLIQEASPLHTDFVSTRSSEGIFIVSSKRFFISRPACPNSNETIIGGYNVYSTRRPPKRSGAMRKVRKWKTIGFNMLHSCFGQREKVYPSIYRIGKDRNEN